MITIPEEVTVRRCTSALMTLVALFAAGELAAQEIRDTTALDPIVVTATKVPLPRSVVTAQVTVLDGDELRADGVDYLLDALKDVAGLTIVQTGSYGGTTALFMRGGESDYVQVLVDGVPVNEPGGSYDLSNLTLHNVDRVEIVHGPASVLYGSDAIAGVIQVFTRDGGEQRVEASIRGGTFGSVDATVSASGGGQVGNYSFSVNNFSSDGFFTRDALGNRFNNDYRNTVASGRFTIRPDGETAVAMSLRYSDSKFVFPTDGSGNFVDLNSFNQSKVTTLGLDITRQLAPRLDGRLLLASNNIDATFDDSADNAADTLGFFEFRSLGNIRRQSVDARLNYYISPVSVLTAGFEIEGQTERSFNQSNSEFGPSNGSFDVTRENRAYYAQASVNVTEQISVNAGFRLDDNDAFGTFLTSRGGIAFRITPNTKLRSSIGTGFKEPTFFETFAEGFALGNPDLDPEESVSWEVGIEQTVFDGLLRVSGTYFDQEFKNLIQFTFAPANPGDPNFFNVAQADASGLELQVAANPVAGLTLSGELAVLSTEVINAGFDAGDGDATFAQGERLLRRPRTVVSFNAAYRVPGTANVHLGINHVGDRIDRRFPPFPTPPSRVVLESYTTVEIAGEVTLIRSTSTGPSVTATLRVENLLDETYQSVFGFPARGRTVFGGVRVAM